MTKKRIAKTYTIHVHGPRLDRLTPLLTSARLFARVVNDLLLGTGHVRTDAAGLRRRNGRVTGRRLENI